jgi:hypothetical protein
MGLSYNIMRELVLRERNLCMQDRSSWRKHMYQLKIENGKKDVSSDACQYEFQSKTSFPKIRDDLRFV